MSIEPRAEDADHTDVMPFARHRRIPLATGRLPLPAIPARKRRPASALTTGLLSAALAGVLAFAGAELGEQTPPPPPKVSCLDYYEDIANLREKGLDETLTNLNDSELENRCGAVEDVLDDLKTP